MKSIKILLMAAFVGVMSAGACGSQSEKSVTGDSVMADNGSKTLVCYFSATGTTAEAARRIAGLIGADLYEITPKERYTDADLDWRDSLSRSSVEMHKRELRPAIVDSLPDMAQYDKVFIGYPNWWNTHPTIINTFIEANDFSGKTIVPFMTSGGSDIVNSEKELREQYPSLKFAKGLLMNSVSDEQIKEWVSAL